MMGVIVIVRVVKKGIIIVQERVVYILAQINIMIVGLEVNGVKSLTGGIELGEIIIVQVTDARILIKSSL
jgi:hypothetical protein